MGHEKVAPFRSIA